MLEALRSRPGSRRSGSAGIGASASHRVIVPCCRTPSRACTRACRARRAALIFGCATSRACRGRGAARAGRGSPGRAPDRRERRADRDRAAMPAAAGVATADRASRAGPGFGGATDRALRSGVRRRQRVGAPCARAPAVASACACRRRRPRGGHTISTTAATIATDRERRSRRSASSATPDARARRRCRSRRSAAASRAAAGSAATVADDPAASAGDRRVRVAVRLARLDAVADDRGRARARHDRRGGERGERSRGGPRRPRRSRQVGLAVLARARDRMDQATAQRTGHAGIATGQGEPPTAMSPDAARRTRWDAKPIGDARACANPRGVAKRCVVRPTVRRWPAPSRPACQRASRSASTASIRATTACGSRSSPTSTSAT